MPPVSSPRQQRGRIGGADEADHGDDLVLARAQHIEVEGAVQEKGGVVGALLGCGQRLGRPPPRPGLPPQAVQAVSGLLYHHLHPTCLLSMYAMRQCANAQAVTCSNRVPSQSVPARHLNAKNKALWTHTVLNQGVFCSLPMSRSASAA